jgi:hypothetical protein
MFLKIVGRVLECEIELRHLRFVIRAERAYNFCFCFCFAARLSLFWQFR